MARYRPVVVYITDNTEGIYYGLSVANKKRAQGEAIRAAMLLKNIGGRPLWVGVKEVSLTI